MRNLLIFILVLVAIWWVRRLISRQDGSASVGDAARRRHRDDIEPMVGCAHCGVHVPESEGVRDGQMFYCSEEHRRLGVRR